MPYSRVFHIACLFLCTLIALPLSADTDYSSDNDGYYEVTQGVREAYQYVLELKLEKARRAVRSLEATEPGNLLAVLVADYADFVELFISEDPELYSRYHDRRDDRLDLLRSGDEESPYYLYARGQVHLHWGVLRFRFGEYFSAAADVNRAFKYLRRNTEAFPEFAPNLKSLGMLKAGVGTIPDKYMWAVRLFSSLDGTIPEGLAMLEQSIEMGTEQDDLHVKEAKLLYAQALFHFSNDKQAAWKFLNSFATRPDSSLLDCLTLSNMALKTGYNDTAIELLENRPVNADFIQIPYLYLMLGRAKIHRLDQDADKAFKSFLQTSNGPTYVKESYQKLGWIAYLEGDNDGYWLYMDSCRTEGASRTDEDQSARHEAERKQLPFKDLLGARLLFDGAYYDESLEILSPKYDSVAQAGFAGDPEYLLELMYRYARSLDASGRSAEALQMYARTIENGQDSDRYFACNAALKSGELYESLGKLDRAEEQFRACLKMKPDEYQGSIHQKAKAGLSRIKDR